MAKSSKRNYALDVLRGVAVLIMLLLSSPPDDLYPVLEHAEWSGMTIPDVALPLFAFTMGTGAAISMSKREPSTRKIFKRVAIIFALGLLINFEWDFFKLLFESGFTAENFWDVAIVHGRPFGVLQRLAITYALAIFLVRAIKSNGGILIAACVLLILSTAGFYIYSPENPYDEMHNISGAVDWIFPGVDHIYMLTHDPEGLYGSIAGTATVLLGFLAGRVLVNDSTAHEKIFLLSVAGIVLLIAGGLWSMIEIVSKNLWTASYALINAGGDALLLALFMKLFDAVPDAKKFFHPLKALGMNPLFFYTANCLILVPLIYLPSPLEGTGFYIWLYQSTTQNIISTEFGATIFCVIWCLLWLPIAEIFYRRGITIKL